MKKSTKAKIINKSIELFNEKGYGAVTLFEIAGALDMTRGNLTYHFKDKDLLLEAIVEGMWSKLDEEKDKTRRLPSFENMHNEVQSFYQIQKKYAFVFLDINVISHHNVRERFQKRIEENAKDMQATIAFAIAAGNMHPEPYEGIYHSLAFNTWMISFFWINQQKIKGEDFENYSEEGELQIWSMLLPHLTEKGLKAFHDFFGEDYMKRIGKSFNSNIADYVGF